VFYAPVNISATLEASVLKFLRTMHLSFELQLAGSH